MSQAEGEQRSAVVFGARNLGRAVIETLVANGWAVAGVAQSRRRDRLLQGAAVAMKIWPGEPFPLGATYNGRGTNFSLFSEVATRVEVCLFDDDGKVYLTSTGSAPGIYAAQIDVVSGKLLSPQRIVWQGTGGRYPEGPHLYKIAGRYYLKHADRRIRQSLAALSDNDDALTTTTANVFLGKP